MSLLAAEGLRFTYRQGATVRQILDGLDLTLEPGQRLGIVGDNGSGKTTLFHCLMGLLPLSAGRILLEGREVGTPADWAGLRRQVGMLFQNADDQLFCPTLLEDVAFGPLNQGLKPAQAQDKAQATLAMLGLEHLAERAPHTLSGGEKRLAALATVLAMEPRALLLDEPTEGLDKNTRGRLMDILTGLDAALAIISHDLDFLATVVGHHGRLCAMHGGKLDCSAGLAVHSHVHVHALGHAPHEHDHSEASDTPND